LEENDFDLIIADHSTALLDAIFFKNKVLYLILKIYQGIYNSIFKVFTQYFTSDHYSTKSKNYFKDAIDIENQEALFTNMVTLGNNNLEII